MEAERSCITAAEQLAQTAERRLLPRFAELLPGWTIAEDRGQPLPADFDPAAHLNELRPNRRRAWGRTIASGESILEWARRQQGDVVCFSQHHADWYLQNWDDERIPPWFRWAVESGDLEHIVVADTVLLSPNGDRFVLRLFCHGEWGNAQLCWGKSWLSDYLDNHSQALVPSRQHR